jgi:hypothetical protein
VFKAVAIGLLLLFNSASLGLQDPTRPATSAASAASDTALTLESVLLARERKIAVINGKLVAEGDSVGGAKVISIGKNNVRLRHRGQIVELVLLATPIRQD